MPERDELDLLIDSELARYGEPRPGLEQRILATVDAESVGRAWIFRGWRVWVWTSGAAVAAVLLAGIPQLRHSEVPVTTARATTPDREPVAAPMNTSPEIPVRHLARAMKGVPGTTRAKAPRKDTEYSQRPKLEVFPAPQPLSAEERALLALATAPSDSGRESLMASQRQSTAPLQISAIQILPITMPEEGKN